MIVSGTEPESASAGDVLLRRPAATGSLAENMAVSPFFSPFFQRSALGQSSGVPSAAVRHTGVPFPLVGSPWVDGEVLFFLLLVLCERSWVRGHLITPGLCGLFAVLTLLSSSPFSLSLSLLATCRFACPLLTDSPTPLYPFIPPSLLPLFLSARPLLRE